MVAFGGGMFSLLPFLVFWLALQQQQDGLRTIRDDDQLIIGQQIVLDSQIEECLPQISTLLASTKVTGQPDIVARNRRLELLVIEKCTGNVHLALKLYWQLQAALGHLVTPTRRGLPQITGELQRAHLFSLLRSAETLAREGKNTPQCLTPLRRRYFDHCTKFSDSLVELSLQLKAVPTARRKEALQRGLDRINHLLFRLMHTRGEEMEEPGGGLPLASTLLGGGPPPMMMMSSGASWLTAEMLAKQGAEVAPHSVHFPLLDATNPVFRVLRVVSGECDVLPSKERCPYLVVAELLQTDRTTRCSAAKLYTHGASLGCSVWDVLDGRKFPESLLYPDDHPGQARFPVRPLVFNSDVLVEDDNYFLDMDAPPHHQQQQGGGGGGYEDGGWSGRSFHELSPGVKKAVTVRKVFGELWHWKEQRIRNDSPFGRLEGWRLASFIVKAGDDLRQEQVAMQVMSLCLEVFREEGLDLWLRPYNILCVGDQAGLLECVSDAKSLDYVKKHSPHYQSMREFYERVYGPSYSVPFRRAQHNFMRSLAAYSIFTHLLQVKDRHNANILVDKQGHLIHIDFGFMLGASPGGNLRFESAPFKFTREYRELLGPEDGEVFRRFRESMERGFLALSKDRHRRRLLDLLRVSISEVPGKGEMIDAFADRLRRAAMPGAVDRLITESRDCRKTYFYDLYQHKTNGIAM